MGCIPPDVAGRMALVGLGGHASGHGEIGGVRAFRAGFVHDVPHALAGLDLLLHPGGAEGLGTAVIEAMALGVPTVAVAAGGLGEIIEDGRNGLLFAPDDDPAFAAGVSLLVGDEERRLALGAAGPERARSFGPDRMVESVLTAYRDSMERSTV
jgi:glycosyltransferase involved in cell wall biosynthesis